jgi:hypothetical protein
MPWTEEDERDHHMDSARCGICGCPDGLSCDCRAEVEDEPEDEEDDR